MGNGAQRDHIDVHPERVERWMDEQRDVQVIDVRETYERDAGHIARSRHIPLAELSAQAASIDSAQPVVFYCRVGSRSQMAAKAFRASGYDAYNMCGGLLRWVSEGRPLTPPGGHVADH